MHRRWLLISSLLALAFGPQLAHAQADRVYDARNRSSTGQITRMSPTELTITTSSGTEQTLPINDVQRIIWADEPAELRRARDAAREGRLEEARDALAKIDPGQIQRDLVRQELQFYRAYVNAKLALVGGGDKSAAAQEVLNFFRQNPNNYHFFEAAELLGDLAIATGNFEEATRYYSAIVNRAPWPEYKLRATVLEGRALAAQGKCTDAISRFESVLGATQDTAAANRLKLMAQIGKARCVSETGQTDQAIQSLEEIIAKNDAADQELFGRAYNALGKCYLDAKKPQDAVLAFLHVDLLFTSDPDIHAEALYHLSQLWSELNQSDRAIRTRSLLKSRYAGTVWANRL